MIAVEEIEAARARIAPRVRRTPVMALSQTKDGPGAGARVSLKLESLQVTGSFKARGAMNRFLTTPADAIAKGLVTASGGNHGLAVARTAAVAGVPAMIFLPSNVSPAKVAKLKGWGARIEIVGDVWDQANEAALDHAGRTGAAYFHPFADPAVVAGQGTLGLEILEDLPDLDTILVAIGGGGLIAGLATAVKARRPDVRIIGIEPTGSPTLRACLDAGACVALPAVTTAVPTMACRQTDPRIYETVRRTVDDIVLVSDEAMAEAARWLWFETGVAADLSGAASIAALQAHAARLSDRRHVCALICGAGPDGIVT
ncbi:MAG TPA: threonine/serine dehydratase [Microvirga sp.]|nr:threonine/serine dehydratase [Microvirga sp.]